jgi:hypothetical protein
LLGDAWERCSTRRRMDGWRTGGEIKFYETRSGMFAHCGLITRKSSASIGGRRELAW